MSTTTTTGAPVKLVAPWIVPLPTTISTPHSPPNEPTTTTTEPKVWLIACLVVIAVLLLVCCCLHGPISRIAFRVLDAISRGRLGRGLERRKVAKRRTGGRGRRGAVARGGEGGWNGGGVVVVNDLGDAEFVPTYAGLIAARARLGMPVGQKPPDYASVEQLPAYQAEEQQQQQQEIGSQDGSGNGGEHARAAALGQSTRGAAAGGEGQGCHVPDVVLQEQV